MVKQYKFFLIAILIGIAVFVRPILFPSDEDVIRINFAEACSLASFDRQLHPIEKLQRSKDIANLFTEDILFKVNSSIGTKEKVVGKDNLVKHVTLAHSYFKNLDIRFKDEKITVTGDKADMHMTAIAKGLLSGDSDDFHDALELIVKFEKISGDWLIRSIENVEMLEK